MGVYEDMANDAGCRYGTAENQQMAAMIEEDHMRQVQEDEYAMEQEMEAERKEILFRKF